MIILEGPPIAKARHRLCRFGNQVRQYDPQEREKKYVRILLSKLKKSTYSSPNAITISMEFHIKPTGSVSQTNLLRWLDCPTKKPDIDNLAKFYLDAANGILWDDDAQVIKLHLSKHYSDKPKTVIRYIGFKPMELDENVKGILSICPPDVLEDLVSDIWKIGLDMHCPIDGQDGLQSLNRTVRANAAAAILSKIADKYSGYLSKITKKYPGHWEKQPERYGANKPPC